MTVTRGWTPTAALAQQDAPVAAITSHVLTRVAEPSLIANGLNLTDRYYRKTCKPRKALAPRTWRTRKNPFESVWDQLCLDLSLCPHLTAKSLLEGLMQRQPSHYHSGQLKNPAASCECVAISTGKPRETLAGNAL